MDQTRNCEESEPSAKRQKSNEDQNQPTADIFKLNVDCLEELFDYLSLRDLNAIGRTCKQLQRVAGYCYHHNYGAVEAEWTCGEIKVLWTDVNGFIKFIKRITIGKDCFYGGLNVDSDDTDEENLQLKPNSDFILSRREHFNQLQSLEKINLTDIILTKDTVESIKEILSKVEQIAIDSCEIDGCFFETVLIFCKNMKRFCVDSWTVTDSDLEIKGNWLQRQYPTLQQFEFITNRESRVPELKEFFELNPNIRSISLIDNFLWLNRDVIIQTKFNLDILAVNFNDQMELNGFYQFLNELYERNIFRRLHFYFGRSPLNQGIIDQMATLKVLRKIRIRTGEQHINLSALGDLEELCVTQSYMIADLKLLPNVLTNLKRLEFSRASFDDILPFISGAGRLNKIKVSTLLTGTGFDQFNNILDLKILNKEREKLINAQKIDIYVAESVYIATKWALKQAEFTLIKLVRAESYEWHHEFECENFIYELL